MSVAAYAPCPGCHLPWTGGYCAACVAESPYETVGEQLERDPFKPKEFEIPAKYYAVLSTKRRP